ncbi:MAG: response regulator transcription factor [Chloroflexota bacterium]|nr:response regulator transcription factor [Chloroflexota bacterium]
MTRVMLVEDHHAFRQALALSLSLEPDLEVVGEAGTVAEARGLIASNPLVDVAVLDLDLPDGYGAHLIERLHAANPGAQVLVLTASVGRSDLAQAVAAGAGGVLHKSADLTEIVAAVRRLAAGQWLLSPVEVAALAREAQDEQRREQASREAVALLTRREREVLALLAEGLSDKEIAARLSIGTNTVHSHMLHLLDKLGVESRLQALIVAVRHGVVSLD